MKNSKSGERALMAAYEPGECHSLRRIQYMASIRVCGKSAPGTAMDIHLPEHLGAKWVKHNGGRTGSGTTRKRQAVQCAPRHNE